MFKKHLFIIPTLFLIVTATFAQNTMNKSNHLEEATFGAGCFWCVEAVFELANGIELVESGYSGGKVKDPTYREVVYGKTGHVEVTRILFDPEIISYNELLEIFWHSHNPTTLNRQGNDVGEQYRSVIFYHNDEQRKMAEASLQKTEQSDLWPDPIVTTIEPLKNYYVAEDYHQNYFQNNPNQPYCTFVVAPKVAKFKKEFKHLLKN